MWSFLFIGDDASKGIAKKKLIPEMEQNTMQEVKMQNTLILF